ncbi:MAG: BREX-1 system adenine-specific DNA-methyltransferase PglX [Christensenellaceae bacterium]
MQRPEQCASCHVRADGRLYGNAAAKQYSPSGQRSWSHGFRHPRRDWQDAVQIIGWLYQYYNTELKDDTFAQLKKNVKITKERIPAATQLFTPDWIVRYMVENSLGRLWLEGHPNAELHDGWKYYLDEAKQERSVEAQLAKLREEYRTIKPEEIKVIDPCVGSGHILVYAFDVLMQIYTSAGWDQREAAQSILKNNLFGLDIDDRAAQLAYFAVMMKARQYDRRLLTRGIQPNIYSIRESNGIQAMTIEYFHKDDPKLKTDIESIVTEMRDAKEYGSILNITPVDFAGLYARFDEIRNDINMMQMSAMDELLPLVKCAELLAQKYDVVVTNPPYMAISNAGAKVNDYVKKNFPNSKADLFAVFIERCGQMAKKNGYQAMITQHAWMFLSSFEKLRTKLLAVDIVNMAHLGARAFEEIGGEVVQTTSFVIRKSHIADYKGEYCRLIEPTSQQGKEDMFLSGENRYAADQSNFSKIPGSPVAYNFSEKIFRAFEAFKPLPEYGITRLGMTTASNETFVRFWFEVAIRRCYLNATNAEQVLDAHAKWVPYNKGGLFRRWFGNMDCVVNWENDGYEIKHFGEDTGHIRSTVPNTEYYFLECGTWSKIASGKIAVRYRPVGSIFDVAGACLYSQNRTNLYLLIAFLNSNVAMKLLSVLSPTMNFEGGHISSLPICIPDNSADYTAKVEKCISISKDDWNSYETSWDFKRNPLAVSSIPAVFGAEYCDKYVTRLEDHYYAWKNECKERFENLQINEEELNRIFIDIYGLQDELTPDVADKDVTVHRVFDSKDDVPESMKGSNYVRTMRDEIVSLISYAVGCMFGRYSLDVDGLAYAGGEWDASKYKTIIPDSDNIIPICDDEYFDDDITGRFVEFVRKVYGDDTLDENLKFVADALGGKGTPREVIRSYFLNDFYADHLKTYQKRPIYWLFDSGKKNGFKALCYMHRYQRDLLARLRTDYVHEQQERYRTQLAQIGDAIDHASASERVKLTKQQKKFQDQATELQKYEEKVHHLADQNIEIDLDDGVKHNYELFADVLAKIK